MTTLYLAPNCMRARRHQESLISSLHQVIWILCNPICVFKHFGLILFTPVDLLGSIGFNMDFSSSDLMSGTLKRTLSGFLE